jgi:alpha,alpha-trehalase
VSTWSLVYEGFDPDQEGLREALCTLGNGYFATRGAAPESEADGIHYPGTYAGGLYDRLVTTIAGREVENEDLVNLPNWLPLTFRIDGGSWFSPEGVEILEHRLELDLRHGVLNRWTRFRDPEGRTTTLTQGRLVSMEDPHFAGLVTTFLAEDWSGSVEVRSALDGRVENDLVPRYRQLAKRHLEPLEQGAIGEDGIWLCVRTMQSGVRVAEAARTLVLRNGQPIPIERRLVEEPGYVAHDLTFDLAEGQPVAVEKVVTLFTSRDQAVSEPGIEARTWAVRYRFGELLGRHELAWEHMWRRFDLTLDGAGTERAQLILRLHIFHLLQTVSANSIETDIGVPARGLHGEAYRGHIFWDELFIFPLLNFRLSALTRSLIAYRHRRLPEARWAARQAGYRGAMYPWQSGSDGREEAQTWHLNPRSGRWLPDNSHLQRHIGLAIAYNVWRYYEVTGDQEFLRFRGGEMLVEISRLFVSLASYDEASGRYEIRGVMGPDEYHDAYPDREQPGLDNNAYTNVMVAWVLARALELPDVLSERHHRELREELGITEEELERWDDMSRRMFVPFHDGVISQFQGYEDLEEFDWEGYRRKYGDISRLDRILEAEGESTNRFKLSKQADVLMLFYLFSGDALDELFSRLGYPFDPGADILRNVEYYERRTSHGSTLSRLVHSWVLARLDRPRSWELFLEALESDVADVQGGTTPEGIHVGAMAGTVDLVQRGYTGLESRGDVLWLNPNLPDELGRLELEVHYRGHRVRIEIDSTRLVLTTRPGRAAPIHVGFRGEMVELAAEGTIAWPLA